MIRRIQPAFVVAIIGTLAVAGLVAQIPAGISLKVSKETAPPGGMAQMKVYITEPQPISTGDASFSFDAYASIDGIALMSPANDAIGVAVVNGTTMTLSLSSPSATFGTDPDYPVLAVAGGIPPGTPVGVKFPLAFDGLQLFDGSGVPYLAEVKPGHLVTAPGLSIHDVKPGSAELPAGAVVTIFGSAFEPRTQVKFSDAKLAQVRFVNAGQIEVVLAQPAHMHGMGIKATNPDGSRSEYFSYQRTGRADPSAHPVFSRVVPVYPYRMSTQTGVAVVGTESGLALQNIEPTAATVFADLVRADGIRVPAVLTVGTDRFVVKGLAEIFGPYDNAVAVCVRATGPVQVMGIAVEGEAAAPVIPDATLAACQ